VQFLHGHVGPVELLRKRIVDAWLFRVDKPHQPELTQVATTLAKSVGVRVCFKCALPVLGARFQSRCSSGDVPHSPAMTPQALTPTSVSPSPFQSSLSSRSTSGTSVSRRLPLPPGPTPSPPVAPTEASRRSPCPSGDRSLQSPAAPRRSPRVPSRSASRDGGTPVSSLLTAAVVSLQGFASRPPQRLWQVVVYELRARGGLSLDPPLLHWVSSSDPLTVCDRWRAHNYSLVGEIFRLDGHAQRWQVVGMASSGLGPRQHHQIMAVPDPSLGPTTPTTLDLHQPDLAAGCNPSRRLWS
jgi:hypothetical protein